VLHRAGGHTGMFPPAVRPSSQQAARAAAAARAPPVPPYQAPAGHTDHNLASALAMIEKLQHELAAERQTVKALRSANVASMADKTELETFFLQCVEAVRCGFLLCFIKLCSVFIF
jgi:hypothetical protein